MTSRWFASSLAIAACVTALAGCTDTHVTDDAPTATIDALANDARALDGGSGSHDAHALDAFGLDTIAAADVPPAPPDATVCPPLTVYCDGRCVDLSHDDRVCTGSGRCELAVACGPREACTEGACTCAPGTLLCSDRCVDPRVDPGHCGACDDACGAAEICADGGCIPAPAGFTGDFGDAWTVLDDVAASSETTCIEELVPRSDTFLYVARGSELAAWDLVRREWHTETPAPYRFTAGCSLAHYGGAIFVLNAEGISLFQPPTHEWRIMPDTSLFVSGMTISDSLDLWSANDVELLRMSPPDSLVSHIPARERLSTPRLTHDARTRRVLVASVGSTTLTSRPLGAGTFRLEAEAPAPIGTTFCSDHDGHVYVGSNDEPHRLWQYDTARAIWTELPSLPSDTTQATNCGVWEQGALYVITQPGHVLRELALDRR